MNCYSMMIMTYNYTETIIFTDHYFKNITINTMKCNIYSPQKQFCIHTATMNSCVYIVTVCMYTICFNSGSLFTNDVTNVLPEVVPYCKLNQITIYYI